MSGRAVVLLHGFAGGPASWDRVVALLPPDTVIHRPWLCGHGPCGPAAGSFDEEVDRIAHQLREERLRGAVLCGYSLGGRVALGLLVRHGDLFARAVIIGASPGLAGEADRAERARVDEGWARLLEGRGLTAFVDAWEKQPLFDTQRRLEAPVLEAQRRLRLSHDARELATGMRTLGVASMPCLLAALSSVTVPATLVVGELDRKFRALADVMAAAMPRARVVLAARCGHNVVLEDPAAVAALVGKDSQT